MTSTRPKLDVRSKTIRGCAIPVAAVGLRVAAQAGAASASKESPATTHPRLSNLVKESFLSLNSGHVTTKALRVSIGVLALLLGALFSTVTEAAPKRVGVPKFEGVQEALARKKVMQILKSHGYDLAKSREMEIGLANSGALLDNDEGFQKVAKELALAAIVTGEIGKKRAKISVHDGRDGSLLGEASFAGANPRHIMAEVGRSFWAKLGGAVERGKAPSGAKKPAKVVAEAPEDDEKTPDAAGGEGGGGGEPPPPEAKGKKTAVAAAEGGEGEQPTGRKKKKKKVRMEGEGEVVQEEGPEVIPPTFEFQAGPRMISRSLSYHQDASMPGLRSYKLFPGPAVFASIVWYPIGPFTDGPAKNIGFEGAIEQGFFVSSTVPPGGAGAPFPMGAKFSTSIHEFAGGARYRVPFGAGNYFWGSLTGGEHAFTFHTVNTSDPTMNRRQLDIPDTVYRYVRPGVGIHVELASQISLTLSGGFRWIFNKGGQFHDEFFTHSTVSGVDAQLTVGYRISSMLEARVSGDLRRYFSSMNCFGGLDAGGQAINQCSPQFTAGGAVDQYFAATAMLAITLGGSEIKMPEEAEEAPPPPKRKRKVESEDEEPPLGDDVKPADKGGGGDE
jgi:hypothetical protein